MKLIVLGGGPAGLNAALQARELHAEVTFTEAVGMAAQKLVRELGLAPFPQLWSDIQSPPDH